EEVLLGIVHGVEDGASLRVRDPYLLGVAEHELGGKEVAADRVLILPGAATAGPARRGLCGEPACKGERNGEHDNDRRCDPPQRVSPKESVGSSAPATCGGSGAGMAGVERSSSRPGVSSRKSVGATQVESEGAGEDAIDGVTGGRGAAWLTSGE